MVSIIVPNYNHASFLKQRIDSILNQTYQDFELILLDDFSTDESKQILEDYKSHKKVAHLIFSESNSGSPFKQWAKGINLAKGKYIWIAESDDFAESTFLERCVEILDTNKEVGFVYCDSNIIENEIIIDTFKTRNSIHFKNQDWSDDYLLKGVKELELRLIQNCTIYNVSSVVFKGEAIRPFIHQISKFQYAGDWVCYMLIALKYDIYYISDILNNYRSHSNNLTKKSGHKYGAMIDRIKARHLLKEQISDKQNSLKLKATRFNNLELRAIFGGFLRGRIKVVDFIKISKYYF